MVFVTNSDSFIVVICITFTQQSASAGACDLDQTPCILLPPFTAAVLVKWPCLRVYGPMYLAVVPPLHSTPLIFVQYEDSLQSLTVVFINHIKRGNPNSVWERTPMFGNWVLPYLSNSFTMGA